MLNFGEHIVSQDRQTFSHSSRHSRRSELQQRAPIVHRPSLGSVERYPHPSISQFFKVINKMRRLFLHTIHMISTIHAFLFTTRHRCCHKFSHRGRIRRLTSIRSSDTSLCTYNNRSFASTYFKLYKMRTRSGLSYSMKSELYDEEEPKLTNDEELQQQPANIAYDDDGAEETITINFPLNLPKSLSPSAAMEFKQCPQSYFFQYILGIKQPTTEALAKGSMCHTALEKLFDYPAEERSLDKLQNLMREAWRDARKKDQYSKLFRQKSDPDTRDVNAERKWGLDALKLLENYVEVEDPKHVKVDPLRREMWVKADLALDPKRGVTYHDVFGDENSDCETQATDMTFLVRGIVDRIDLTHDPNTNASGLRIVDYKTGKAPNFKYSKAMNKKIADEAMWQLKIYALLLREMFAKKRCNDLPDAELRSLRLLYLTSASGKGQYLDFDLGDTEAERDATLNEVHIELSEIWSNITKLVNNQDPREFVGCTRSFCYCHKLRPKFEDGVVWSR